MKNNYHTTLVEFFLFGIVGGLNTLVDMGVLALLIAIFGLPWSGLYIFYKCLSFLVAMVNSYFWNRTFVFALDSKSRRAEEFFQFAVVSVIGLILNVGTASFFFALLDHVRSNGILGSALLSALIGTVVVMIWNFTGYKYLVFKK